MYRSVKKLLNKYSRVYADVFVCDDGYHCFVQGYSDVTHIFSDTVNLKAKTKTKIELALGRSIHKFSCQYILKGGY